MDSSLRQRDAAGAHRYFVGLELVNRRAKAGAPHSLRSNPRALATVLSAQCVDRQPLSFVPEYVLDGIQNGRFGVVVAI
jgi:hypothetical protein